MKTRSIRDSHKRKYNNFIPSGSPGVSANTSSGSIVVDGVVGSYVCVMGVQCDVWWWKEVIHPGAFTKTISERGPIGSNQVRVLWSHRQSEVIGMPLKLEEHTRDQLPDLLIQAFPEATGGLFASTQFIQGVRRADEAILLYNSGAMSEFSIGFRIVNADEEILDEEDIMNIREVKLFEYSPVAFGANPATGVVSSRSNENEIIKQARALLDAQPNITDVELLHSIKEHLGKDKPVAPLVARSRAALLAECQQFELEIESKLKR